MGKQPAVVIIARHGSRIDQANKQWHTTSATPYDPPLTYGGWSQCQILGARIGSILQTRQDEAQAKYDDHANGIDESRRRKRQRVIIHSSPFTRCIQTSVAISAGIGQHEKTGGITTRHSSIVLGPISVLNNGRSHADSGMPETQGHPSDSSDQTKFLPAKLRVDAFLGEWLSPDYFENITPPPGSLMMVANAKVDLLRPAEEIRGADLRSAMSGGPSAAQNFNQKSRATSFNTELRSASRIFGTIHEEDSAYSPPVPTYAISASGKIPTGFFAHARDACLEIDYRWDSMREPHDWGDGGEFGEEWSSMHRRFRNGLQRMLAWYENEDEDENEEIVLVLVTHGAGCNALIGAMTGAPVLLDVGVASLTMAVRKKNVDIELRPVRARRGSLDLGLSQQFDMKVIASTEHLRTANPLGLNSPRLGRSPAIATRRAVGPDSPEGFSLGDPLSWRPGSASGLSRSASLRSQHANTPVSSSGLWSTNSGLSRDETVESSESESLPNYEGVTKKKMKDEEEKKEEGEEDGEGPQKHEAANEDSDFQKSQMPLRSVSQVGLWGAAPIRGDSGSKRRWTLVDKSP